MAKDNEKKAQRAAKWAKRRQTWAQLWQAFNMQRKQDKALVPFMVLALLAPAVVGFVLGIFWGNRWVMGFSGLILGVALAMMVFTRRLQNSVYAKAEGQPGAAGWACSNMRNGVGMLWITKQAVQVNNTMDMVHRVVGCPGVVLVAEGHASRLKPMLAKERKRLARIVGNTPIYEVIVGTDEGQVKLSDLQRHLMRLPRNIKREKVAPLASRIESLENARPAMGMPKGPLPPQAKVGKGMQRRARRAAERNQRG